jgi:hypothetical protein
MHPHDRMFSDPPQHQTPLSVCPGITASDGVPPCHCERSEAISCVTSPSTEPGRLLRCARNDGSKWCRAMTRRFDCSRTVPKAAPNN